MITSVEIKGLSELLRKLRELPEAMQNKLVRPGCATGLAVIKNEAIRLAPEWTGPVSANHPPPGALKRAIYQTRLTSQCTPTLEVWKLSVRKGNRYASGSKGNRDAYYASWVEFGHYARVSDTVQGGRAARRAAATLYVLPRPFMRPAFEAKSREAVQAMQDYVTANLPEIVRTT